MGGALHASATNAVHVSFVDVARIRAEPRLVTPPRTESIGSPTAPFVAKTTVAPGATVSDVATASLHAAPPAEQKSSTPACIAAVSVDVQPKKVSRQPPRITLGTE